jgi:hypothetical protein
MKVLFCKNSFAGPISGADEIAVTYAVELKAAGHSTGVLLVHPPAADDPLAARLREAGGGVASLKGAQDFVTAADGAVERFLREPSR